MKKKTLKNILIVVVLMAVISVITSLFMGAKYSDNVNNFVDDIKEVFNNDEETDDTNDAVDVEDTGTTTE